MVAILKQLIAPTGLLWLMLWVLVVVSLRRKDRPLAWLSGITLVLLTVFGNGWVASASMAWLTPAEVRRSAATRDIDGPFDAVIVLGGCVAALPSGDVCLTESGDRVAVAVELYHSERTQRIVVAGGKADDLRAPMHVGATMFRSLGVPDADLTRLPGTNTSAELAGFQRLAQENGWERVGVVTDSWHMRRVLTWTARNDFAVTPLPAGSLGDLPTFSLFAHTVPTAGALRKSRLVIYELVGGVLTAMGLR